MEGAGEKLAVKYIPPVHSAGFYRYDMVVPTHWVA